MGRLMRAAERTILNRTDLVAVLSSEMKDQLRSIGITVPIEVIPLWVDTDHIQVAPAVTRSSVKVLYSLTSMGCPAGAMIAEGIVDAARGVPGVAEVEAELTFDPPWTPDRMSDDAKFILGFG